MSSGKMSTADWWLVPGREGSEGGAVGEAVGREFNPA